MNPGSRPGYAPLDAPRRPELLPASFASRAGAFLVDLGVAFACVPVPVAVITWLSGQTLNPCTFEAGVEICPDTDPGDLLVSRILFWSFATVFVLAFSWAMSHHHTLGEQTNGLRVVDDESGERIWWRRAILRTLAMAVSAAPLGLGYWWALVDASGRTWHDIVARTRVISV